MLAVIGAGGHARAAYECFHASGKAVHGFFDDDISLHGSEVIDGHLVIGSPSSIPGRGEIKSIFVAIGDNRVRLRQYEYFRGKGYLLPDALHPRSYISSFSKTGRGLFLMGASIINPAAVVDDYCIINTSATVGHDCKLGRAVQIAPGVNIGGGTILEEGVFVGIGARIAPGLRIGAWSVVGAGAVVLKDVPAGVFVCGIPAAVKKQLPSPNRQDRE
ncbi:MAG: acetyltransferase [Firmicutes bacterium]|jgi:UDP-perosamine 4-acetyltransferase|nr:acetyltransferase [Bacillota bacterium]